MYVTAQDKLLFFQSKPISGLSNVTMTQLLQKNLDVILDHSFFTTHIHPFSYFKFNDFLKSLFLPLLNKAPASLTRLLVASTLLLKLNGSLFSLIL